MNRTIRSPDPSQLFVNDVFVLFLRVVYWNCLFPRNIYQFSYITLPLPKSFPFSTTPSTKEENKISLISGTDSGVQIFVNHSKSYKNAQFDNSSKAWRGNGGRSCENGSCMTAWHQFKDPKIQGYQMRGPISFICFILT